MDPGTKSREDAAKLSAGPSQLRPQEDPGSSSRQTDELHPSGGALSRHSSPILGSVTQLIDTSASLLPPETEASRRSLTLVNDHTGSRSLGVPLPQVGPV